ncbi:MAG: MBL fold metallo-hydrolase [Oscillospiraceae bacterium]|nr:MBL fold metallo-hydrolase [Oscillospiraceae bacterium]
MLGFNITKINPSLYLLKDPLGVNIFLMVGENKALLFDTGHGVAYLPTAVKALTDKPLTVVLGHGHIDHANGAYQFDEVYLREPDYELCREHTGTEIRTTIINRLKEAGLKADFNEDAWIKSGACKLKPLDIGTVFDLGGLNVEVIDMAGHTGGSIGLLIKEQRILIDSDSANSHCWMFVPQSLSVKEYIKMLERVKELDFDVFYVAHQDHAHPKSDFDKYITVAKNATLENSEPYENWQEHKPRIYTEGDVSIVVNERTLG